MDSNILSMPNARKEQALDRLAQVLVENDRANAHQRIVHAMMAYDKKMREEEPVYSYRSNDLIATLRETIDDWELPGREPGVEHAAPTDVR
jgi:hypothetical protein